jgi:hypothetical protein
VQKRLERGELIALSRPMACLVANSDATSPANANDRNFFHFVCSLIFNAWAKNP